MLQCNGREVQDITSMLEGLTSQDYDSSNGEVADETTPIHEPIAIDETSSIRKESAVEDRKQMYEETVPSTQ